MNDFRHLPDDAKITAYALGELDGDERVAVERMLNEDPKARGNLEEIRAMATELETVFDEEPVPADVLARRVMDPYGAAARKKSDRFPKIIHLFGGLAAAGVAVVLALYEPPQRKPVGKTYHEVRLPASLPSVIMEDEADGIDETTRSTAAVMEPTGVSDGASGAISPPFGLLEQSKLLTQSTHSERGTRNTASWPVFQFRFSDSGSEPELAPRLTQRDRSSRRIVNMGTAQHQSERGSRATAGGAQIVLAGFSRSGVRESAAELGPLNTERYAYRRESGFLAARAHPLSTFSADVDTASYANVRRFIRSGRLPPVDAVRIEEMLNYFPYRYEAPPREKAGDVVPPFAATMEVAAAPWAPAHRLVRIGLRGRDVATAERGAANLVFLVDVSASMSAPNKLPLVRESMRLLLTRLRPDDRVAIVTYAGVTELALSSTPVAKAREINAVLDQLRPSGSTNGGMGIQLAYDVAKANYVTEGINRVILCTDGDFNMGVSDEGGLVRLIEEKAKSGVVLTVLGFGMGNLNDSMMQRLANHGNGSYGYVDSEREAGKLLVNEVNGTLVTIAKDVKIQVGFNVEQVASYRLIGYERRLLATEEFDDDTVDAGEIGAGHTVTALYEIVPVDSEAPGRTTSGPAEGSRSARVASDPVSVAASSRERSARQGDSAQELLTLTVRYKEPSGEESRRLEFALVDEGREFAQASDDFKFAAGVAGFGMILRDSPHKGSTTFAAVRMWAEAGMTDDSGGYRAEFGDLLRRAEALQ